MREQMQRAVQFVRENRSYLRLLRERGINFKQGSRILPPLDLPEFHKTKNMQERISPVPKLAQEPYAVDVTLKEGVVVKPFFDPAQVHAQLEDAVSYNG